MTSYYESNPSVSCCDGDTAVWILLLAAAAAGPRPTLTVYLAAARVSLYPSRAPPPPSLSRAHAPPALGAGFKRRAGVERGGGSVRGREWLEGVSRYVCTAAVVKIARSGE